MKACNVTAYVIDVFDSLIQHSAGDSIFRLAPGKIPRREPKNRNCEVVDTGGGVSPLLLTRQTDADAHRRLPQGGGETTGRDRLGRLEGGEGDCSLSQAPRVGVFFRRQLV